MYNLLVYEQRALDITDALLDRDMGVRLLGVGSELRDQLVLG